MKSSLGISQDEINQIGQLTEDELQNLYELEQELDVEIN